MNSFELNKIMGAVTGAFAIIVAVHILIDILMTDGHHGAHHRTYAYATQIEGAAAVEVAVAPPVETFLAIADAAVGERLFRQCVACHKIDEGGANAVGPALWGVVGRAKAALAEFKYSKALIESGGSWGFRELDGFLENPRAYAPGTAMAYRGMRDPEDRANLIAYLNSQSNAPLPLPTPEEAAALVAPEPE